MVDLPSQPAVNFPGSPVRRGLASARAWVAERLTTTPGKLVLMTALVVAGAVCFGVIASLAERSRAHAASAVRTQTEPLLVQSVLLYTALSDANATATTTFLTGGLEPPALRARYLADLRRASDSLATLTRQGGSSADIGAAVREITEQLPVYSGLVESARANNRQGFPVGAAYLRAASALLTGTILPAANRVYATEATHLSENYGTGTAAVSLIILIIAVVLALALLAGAQVLVARMSRRVVNVPMAVATAVVIALSLWAVVSLIGEQHALAKARGESDSAELLSASRVLFSRAQSDQSLILANRGSDETDPADFAAVMQRLRPPGGLLAAAAAGQSGDVAHRLYLEFDAYETDTAHIAALESEGQISEAAHTGASSAGTTRLGPDLSQLASTAQRRFTAEAADADSSLTGLSIAIPVLTVLGAALAVFGLRQRLEEYR